MIDRVIDLAKPSWLKVKLENLVITPNAEPAVIFPLSELAVLVASHPQICYTQAALAGMAQVGAVLVVCDAKHMPVAMQLPFVGNYLQGERFARQAAVKLPVKKKLWQEIVRAKIKAQGKVLLKLRGEDGGLSDLRLRVHSGDKTNVEALAARRYWQLLFNDPNFRRRREGEDQNRLLNYGYAVLRAIIARSICAAGLHPSLSVQHHNRYDAFCLASDLMEPFRPIVDEAVARIMAQKSSSTALDKAKKGEIIKALLGRFKVDNEVRTLFDIGAKTAFSLAMVFSGEAKKLALPDI